MAPSPPPNGDPDESYWRIWWFFFPLALTFTLITFTHTLINGAIGRIANPEPALAAYAVARSVMQLAQNPTMMVRQVVTALVTDRASYDVVRRVVYRLMLVMAGLIAILAWTPVGAFVLRSAMGLEGDALRQGILALRVFTVFPLISVHRNLGQGLAILANANAIVPVASTARLLSLAVVLEILLRVPDLSGALLGAIAFSVTMFIEAAILFIAGRPALRKLRTRPTENTDPLTTRQVLSFYVPLMGTTFVAGLTIPLVQAGVGQVADAQTQIAAFAVAWALSMVITSPANMLHQAALTFTRDGRPNTYRRSHRFALGVGIGLSALTALVAFTPFGTALLIRSGATPALMEASRGCLQVFALLPLARGWREYCWGVLMRKRLTQNITYGKSLGLLSALSVMALGLLFGVEQTAALGAWSLVGGEIVEGFLLHRRMATVLGKEFSPTVTAENTVGPSMK